jgi:hypothetical protein
MESTNGQVRPMPGYGNRNGMVTRFKPYVYRGTGYDIMPWATTAEIDEDAVIVLDAGDHLRPRTLRRCKACGGERRSKRHREHCG